jgi:hypothetical protein
LKVAFLLAQNFPSLKVKPSTTVSQESSSGSGSFCHLERVSCSKSEIIFTSAFLVASLAFPEYEL